MPRGVRHVLLRGHARDGGLVQAQRLGDLAQHERAHRHLAVLEEVPLAVDDRLRHAQDRLEALLHVLDEPARLLQLLARALAAVCARAGGMSAYRRLMRRRGIASGLRPRARRCRALRTTTSGTT